MKLTIKAGALAGLLKTAGIFRSMNGVTSLRVKDGKVQATAGDGPSRVFCSLPLDGGETEEGESAVSYDILLNLLQSLPAAKEVTITTNKINDSMKVAWPEGNASMTYITGGDQAFRDAETAVTEEYFRCDAAAFARAYASVLPFICTDVHTNLMNMRLEYAQQKLTLVTSSGHTLAVTAIPATTGEGAAAQESVVHIPLAVTRNIHYVLSGPLAGEVSFGHVKGVGGVISIPESGIRVIYPADSARWPEWRRLVLTEGPTMVSLPAEALISAVNTVSAQTKDVLKFVASPGEGLMAEEGKVEVSTKSVFDDKFARTSMDVPATVTGEGVSAAFSTAKFSQALRQMKTGDIEVVFSGDGTKPVLLHTAGDGADDLKIIMMPMRES